MGDGYEATLQLARERADLIPLLRLIHDMGDKAFNDALAELERRGLLVVDSWGYHDTNGAA